jgi:hypothetical protein
MHLTAPSGKEGRSHGVSDDPRRSIAEARSAGDLHVLTHLMQFPRVGVVRGHLSRLVIEKDPDHFLGRRG